MGRKAPWDHWYGDSRWLKARRAQLLREPLCAMCLKRALVEPATVVDHVEPHHGDWNLFRLGKLQSLCKLCHDKHKRIEEQSGYSRAIGEDGFPTDERHPFWSYWK